MHGAHAETPGCQSRDVEGGPGPHQTTAGRPDWEAEVTMGTGRQEAKDCLGCGMQKQFKAGTQHAAVKKPTARESHKNQAGKQRERTAKRGKATHVHGKPNALPAGDKHKKAS